MDLPHLPKHTGRLLLSGTLVKPLVSSFLTVNPEGTECRKVHREVVVNAKERSHGGGAFELGL